MAEPEPVRIEIGFHGGDVLAVRVPPADADALEAGLRGGDGAAGLCELHAEDGRLLVVLSHVRYVKRYAREARVGFTR